MGARQPLSSAYGRLGAELRRVRQAAGATTREVAKPDGTYYRSGSISNIEAGYSQPSLEVIKAYARLGGRYADLVALLQAAKQPSSPTAEPDDVFERLLLEPKTDPRLLRRGYAVDHEEDFIRVGPNRAPTRNTYRVAVRPLSPNARFFVFRYGHEPDPRTGVVAIEAGPGCELSHVDENDEGTVLAVLEFEPGATDELGRCVISWDIHVCSEVPQDPQYVITAASLMAHLTTHVEFAPPATPSKMWWFRGVDPYEPRLQPQAERVLPLTSNHLYARDFYDVQAESCGLGWRWREE